MKKLSKRTLKWLLALCIAALAVLLAAVTFSESRFIPTWSEIYSSFGGRTATAVEDADADFVRFIDVGQGDSILISSNGRNALIDFGGNADDGRGLYTTVRQYGIDTFDCILITHYDADHIGGADTVLESFTVYNVIVPAAVGETSAAYMEVKAALEQTDAAVYIAQTGTVIHIGDFELTIVGYYDDETDSNDRSIIVMAELEGFKFLFTGDAGKDVETRLLADGLDLDCDVYKASHHGSSTGNTEDFLESITPEYAVISCGENNSYGHPHEEVLERLEAVGAEIYRTDDSGDITFYIRDGELIAETEY